MLLLFSDILVICWLVAWSIVAVRHLSHGKPYTVCWVILVHSFFVGVPIVLDYLIGVPNYEVQPGFRLAADDAQTRYIYNLYACLTPVILWVFGRPKGNFSDLDMRSAGSGAISRLQKHWKWLLIPLVAPVIVVAFAPDPAFYLEYAAVARESRTEEALAFHPLVALFARLSVATASLLILVTRNLKLGHILFLAPWVMFDIWVFGKRSIIALALVVIGYALWRNGVLRGARLYLAGTVALIGLLLFSVNYQDSIRGIGSGPNSDYAYTVARVDYGRDSQIKMTIFSELYPNEMQILEHRGQSILFYAMMYVPREYYPEKPMPYAQYFTSAMLLQEPQFWGWGMTTSWLEEAIANFGWFGMILGPIVPATISRLSDGRDSAAVRLLGVLVAILLLVVELVAYAPVAALWVLLLIRSKPSSSIAGSDIPVHREQLSLR